MRRLGIVTVGLALVVGIVVGGIVGNPFDGRASATTAAVGGRLIELGTQTVGPGESYLSPMVQAADCAQMDLMAWSPTEPPLERLDMDYLYTSPDGTTRIMADGLMQNGTSAAGEATVSKAVSGPWPYVQFDVTTEPPDTTADITAWIWCATSPSYAVGGIAELPALAGTDGSGMGGATYAVLAGAAAGVLAFAVLATLSVKRRRVS